VLLHEADPEQYVFVRHQPDLASLFRGPRLELFENLSWRGSVLPLGPAAGSAFDLDDAGKVTEQLFPAKPLGPETETGFLGPLARFLPGWRSIALAGATHVATGDRCTDGWRLGTEEPVCHMGTVAAFANSDQADTLWRPAAAMRVAGLLVSGLTIGATLFYGREKNRARDR
jgi:hypothetical protein